MKILKNLKRRKWPALKQKITGLATLRAVGGVPIVLTVVCLKNKRIPQNISRNMAVSDPIVLWVSVILTTKGTTNKYIIIQINCLEKQYCHSDLNLCCFIVVHGHNRANQEWKHEKRLRWLRYCTFCLFNLKDCDITYMSRGAVSCHYTPPLCVQIQDMVYTGNIYLCVSDGETQYPHSKFLPGQTGKWRPVSASDSQWSDGLKSKYFLTGIRMCYFVGVPLHLCIVNGVQIARVCVRRTFQQLFSEQTV